MTSITVYFIANDVVLSKNTFHDMAALSLSLSRKLLYDLYINRQ